MKLSHLEAVQYKIRRWVEELEGKLFRKLFENSITECSLYELQLI